MYQKPTYEELELRVDALEKKAARLNELEESLRLSEEKFTKVFMSGPNASTISRLSDSKIIECNDSFLDTLGYKKEEILNKELLDLDIIENRYEIEEYFSILRKAGQMDDIEITLLSKEGRRILFVVSSRIIELSGETFVYTKSQNITHQKKVEKDFRESEERMRLVVQNMPVMVAAFGEGGNIIVWNRECENVIGYLAEEVIDNSKALEMMIPNEQYRKKIESSIKKEEGNFRNLEFSLARKDGKKRIVLWSNLSEEHPIPGWASWNIGIDITKLKQALEELEKSENKYRLMTENIDDIIWSLDMDFNFKYLSPAIEKLMDWPVDDIKKLTMFDFVPPSSMEEVERVFNQNLIEARRTGDYKKPAVLEIQQYRKDKSLMWTEIRSSFEIDENGKAVGIYGVTRDITERKIAEEEKEQLKATLQQTHKMEALGTLAGGIAHDFNNILSSIIMNSELAYDELPENFDCRYSIEQVLKSSHRAKELVKQILMFSRASTAEYKEINIGPVVIETIKMLRSIIPSTIDIRYDVPYDTGSIQADSTQIQQLVLNLCTNAAHAMEDKGGVLNIKINDEYIGKEQKISGLEQGLYLKLIVKDSGHGIPTKNIDRIFDPFFTTKQTGKGAGLGLSVVHGIVMNIGGAITVDSREGNGTVFQVLLPITDKKCTFKKEKKKPVRSGDESILFIDDEEDLLDSGKRTLERLGYKVTTSKNPKQTIELFRCCPEDFNLVITDMTMPFMTGIELSRELLDIRDDIPIILCSGYSQLITPEKVRDSGIRDFIMKPFAKNEIAEIVRKVLDEC
ncbi:MAG: PAS domain S-box protein [Desulfobacterales bacterium]|nr:PAS domain S-box protein [Desulfobacteraceae bacterium]MBT7085391.1 PAS domain S-box protein [Desulfobacterales bacterium]